MEKRWTDGRRLDGYTISSPCEPNGSGGSDELKILQGNLEMLEGVSQWEKAIFFDCSTP